MNTSVSGISSTQLRVNWVRLRTLIVLRWIAVAGQSAALLVAPALFGLSIDLGLAFLVVGASGLVNVAAILIYPRNKRLTEAEMAMQLVFDICQIGALLHLTGGLHNPFSLLMLGPVTVSAMALKSRTTILIGLLSIGIVSFLALYSDPVATADGEPLRMRNELLFGFWAALIIGVIFLSVFAQRVTSEVHAMSDALSATQMALAREQKLTDLGGVVAAAAHELGTPLATIKLASSELIEELQDQPDLREDAILVRDQADRCRDILRSMGRAGKADLHMKHTPIGEVLREAAEPHEARGIRINFDIAAAPGGSERQPTVTRRPEIVHGLRNLIQNAVDFARDDIWIDVRWTDERITVVISDDGPGFAPDLIGRLGDPFLQSRGPDHRDGYDSMGLGLFIAKTLLERSGARITFSNGFDAPETIGVERRGAIVVLDWPIGAISVEPQHVDFGPNLPLYP